MALDGYNISTIIKFFHLVLRQISFCRTMYYMPCVGESALMARAFNYLVLLMVIDSAAQVGAASGDSPCFCSIIKKNKIRTSVKATRCERGGNLNNFRFTRDIKTKEANDWVQSGHASTEEKKSAFRGGW